MTTYDYFDMDNDYLIRDREFVLRRLKNGILMKHDFDQDEEIMLLQVTLDPYLIMHMSIRGVYWSKDFILDVVRLNGFAVFYVEDRLKWDKEILAAAAVQIGVRWEDDLRMVYRNIVIASFRVRDWPYSHLDEWLRDDHEIMRNEFMAIGLSPFE